MCARLTARWWSCARLCTRNGAIGRRVELEVRLRKVDKNVTLRMRSPASFAAPPKKRIAAFAFDSFAILLMFLAVAGLAESIGLDLGTFRCFVVVAATYHLAFLAFRDGRTFGKQAQDICVISAAGERASYFQALVRVAVRYLPLALLTVEYKEWETVPALLGLSIRVFTCLLWLREIHLLQHSPIRQTLADSFARTFVVNMPTVQPHRAPAIPMFSANDAEFGNPPKLPPRGPKQ
jgi:uncharacterized RDD family membrane protein YckC